MISIAHGSAWRLEGASVEIAHFAHRIAFTATLRFLALASQLSLVKIALNQLGFIASTPKILPIVFLLSLYPGFSLGTNYLMRVPDSQHFS